MVDFGSDDRFHRAPALRRRKEALRRVDALQGFIPSFRVPQTVWQGAALAAAIRRLVARIAASQPSQPPLSSMPANT